MVNNYPNNKTNFLASWMVESYNRTGNWSSINAADLQKLDVSKLKALNHKVTDLLLKSGKGLQAIKSFKDYQLLQFAHPKFASLEYVIYLSQYQVDCSEKIQNTTERNLRLVATIEALGIKSISTEKLKNEAEEKLKQLQSADGIENAASSDIKNQETIFFDLYDKSIQQVGVS